MALGGAFAARASDASAIYFNPAGLAFQSGTKVYLGTTLIMPKVSFFGPINNDPTLINNETKMVDQTFTPINVYVTHAVTEDLHVGIGVNNPYGLGTEWPSDWAGKFISQKVDLQSFFFTPTVSYKISDQLSFGVGLNYVTGKATVKRVVSDPFDPHATVSIEASGTGIGYNAGVLYKFSSELSIGASYRTSVKLEPTGTATFEPSRAVYPAGDVDTKIELPATGFLGVAYTPMKNLTLEGDYQFVGWSSYNELRFTFKKDGSESVSPKNYEDSYILRFGAEYTMDNLQLRAGYLFDRSPVTAKYVEPLLPDANRNGFNIGFGYSITEQLSVDVSYLFLKFDQRKAENTEVTFDGTYNSSANLIGINFGYSF